MADLTPAELNKRIERLKVDLANGLSTISFKVAQDQKARMSVRIFTKGQDVNNKKIGNYSTAPTFVTWNSFPNRSDAERISNPQWKTIKRGGKNYPLILLEGGYKQVRELAQLRTDTVDLSFRGDLQASLDITQEKNNQFNIVIKGAKNVLKARGNEEHFDKEIFGVTDEERKKALDFADGEIFKIISKALA